MTCERYRVVVNDDAGTYRWCIVATGSPPRIMVHGAVAHEREAEARAAGERALRVLLIEVYGGAPSPCACGGFEMTPL
jgi:hypothetical protein